MGEDSFDRARTAFFGTEKAITESSTSPAELLKPRNTQRAEKELPASDEHEAAQPATF
jgi:hypothetical protein